MPSYNLLWSPIGGSKFGLLALWLTSDKPHPILISVVRILKNRSIQHYPNGSFSELYLENFRLWQMMVACGIAWITEQLKTELKVPLDTAHLILVSHTTLSIRFRFEEKRFDVDGAYDVRHEIIKSRLDKATVKGRSERLTQPGMIAVVFSQPQEGREVCRHMEFLSSKGYLKRDVEALDVEELPGVQGLRAMRASVDLESPVVAEHVRRLFRPVADVEVSVTDTARKP